MLRFFEFLDTFTKFGFCTTTITNIFFIYITLFHTKNLVGTYKLMILTFAVLGIVFSGFELIARPFVHNYNKGFIYFSLNTWMDPGKNLKFLQLSMTVYAGCYAVLLSFIAVQFVFRYFSLVKSNVAKKFEGVGILMWMCYPLMMGGIYGCSLWVFAARDNFADGYFEEDVLKVYLLAIREVPRMSFIYYDPDGSFRWHNLTFFATGIFLLSLQYTIILVCGVQMQMKIKEELQNFSPVYQKLHRQFFRALVIQTFAPTILFVLPLSTVLLVPMLDMKVSVQSGIIYALFSLYPPFDSLAFMWIVSEYREVNSSVNVTRADQRKQQKTLHCEND